MNYAHSVKPGQMERATADIRLIPRASEPTHAERAKTIVHSTNEGFLSTIGYRPAGYPFGSVVRYSLMPSGVPLLCLSQLAEHTKNLVRDPKASLMVAEHRDAGSDPLEYGRVTLVGDLVTVEKDDKDEARETYLASFPSAYYVEFDDFDFYTVRLEAVRYVGGFGMMSWVKADQYIAAEPDPLRPAARDIIEHMNQDHRDALLTLAKAYAEVDQVEAATMIAVDRYGFDVVVDTDGGKRAARILFTKDVTTPEASRVEIISLLTSARKKLGVAATKEGHH